MKPKRYCFMDLLRILSFFIIICYHFFKDLNYRLQLIVPDPDVMLRLGDIHLVILAVSLFFIISGAGLTLKMRQKFDALESLPASDSKTAGSALCHKAPAGSRISSESRREETKRIWKAYYKGRFFQIMIPFYVSYLIYAAYRLWITKGTVFEGIPAWRFIFTILGIDEYLNMSGFPTFSLGIGEWFLGALILIYAIFPLLYYCMEKWEIPTLAAVCLYYVLLITNYNSAVPWHLNVLVKICEFILGMFFARHMEDLRRMPALSLLVLTPLLPLPAPIENTLFAAGIFILVALAEPLLRRSAALGNALKFIGGYTFYIYLIHHAAIYTLNDRVAWRLGPGWSWRGLVLFAGELFGMVVGAVIIRYICDCIRRFAHA